MDVAQYRVRHEERLVAQTALGRGRPKAGGYRREAWRARYPSFPRILLVLDGAPDAQLAKRTDDLRALVAADARLQPAADLQAGVTTLEQLRTHGPFAPIVTPALGDPEPTDVLLRPSAAAASVA